MTPLAQTLAMQQRDAEALPRNASPLLVTSPADAADVFEGPEKKLEVFFCPPTADGLRCLKRDAWAEVLALASCSILHCSSNAHFDAYLLSESSLFVYPHKVILKTCGTTTLLLVMPRLLALAGQLGAPLSHVHYSHLRYKYPQLQLYPHSSFEQERAFLVDALSGHATQVNASILGQEGGADSCWYALCSDGVAPAKVPAAAPAAAVPASASSSIERGVLEVAMEGLPPHVCARFFGDDAMHAGLHGKRLAASMSRVSGIAKLVAGTLLDDWAFEPCGYSMNALRGEHYYTVHITPEADFSYASFETTDPAFATAEKLAEILAIFEPTNFTLTLTTRGAETPTVAEAASAHGEAEAGGVPLETSADGFVLGAVDLALQGFACASNEGKQLAPAVAVTCATFEAVRGRAARDGVPSPSSASTAAPTTDGSLVESDSDSTAADSESTAPLDELDKDCADDKVDDKFVADEKLASDEAEDSGVLEVTKKARTACPYVVSA